MNKSISLAKAKGSWMRRHAMPASGLQITDLLHTLMQLST